MTNEELVALIQSGTDKGKNLCLLYDKNKRLICRIVNQYRGIFRDIEDLEQEGYFGLVSAAENYDLTYAVSFSSYAVKWIRQRILAYIAENESMLCFPRNIIWQIHQYNRIKQKMIAEGKTPTIEAMAERMQITIKASADLQQYSVRCRAKSLDESALSDSEGNEETLADIIPCMESGFESVEEKIHHEQMSAALWDEVRALPAVQSDVIQLLYRDGMSLGEVAEQKNVPYGSVRDTKEKALRKLRAPHVRMKLKPFLDFDLAYSMGLQGTGLGTFKRTGSSATERAAIRGYEADLHKLLNNL